MTDWQLDPSTRLIEDNEQYFNSTMYYLETTNEFGYSKRKISKELFKLILSNNFMYKRTYIKLGILQ